ncbi:hypothetical protein SEA_DAUBENSKI_186 [Streptomyces phage Daubenski]|uniref:Uncharacterized protein n=1 Tax=Streptomyces phage Daubenski TaxID=2653725 RepID=A0A5Q2WGD6_9CAUD|nr:hypothetical protein KNU80_gp114 [Streptomyces phage Daubenski]QGH76458.1 hypothetical protein SEA_DAUBENSKI_186 [Streptomyces phage Daubenski]
MITWYWLDAAPEAVAYFKKKKAVKVNTINGIEIWRDAYGYSRLIKESDGKIQVSSQDFLSIKEATDAINDM